MKEFDKCDFSLIQQHLKERIESKRVNNEERKKELAAKKEHFAWATVNGERVSIGNHRIEPPGLFLGRGDHPKEGTIKRRIVPEDIVLNLGEDAPIPPCPSGKPRFFFLSSTFAMREQQRNRFEPARKFYGRLETIRNQIALATESEDETERQLGTSLWLIDRLGFRIGSGSEESESFDMVGISSLRVEHLLLGASNSVHLDFIDSTSLRFKFNFSTPSSIWSNLSRFTAGKDSKSLVFDKLWAGLLRERLDTLLPGLQPRHFRICNCSAALQSALELVFKRSVSEATSLKEKILFYNRSFYEATAQSYQGKPSTNIALEMEIETLKSRKNAIEVQLRLIDKARTREQQAEVATKLRPDLPQSFDGCVEELNEQQIRLDSLKDREDLSKVNIASAKWNDFDPRITITWCKRVGLPLERVFNRSLREKFEWAIMECNQSLEFKY